MSGLPAKLSAQLDRTVRWLVYRYFEETTRAPDLRRLARLAEATVGETAASLRRLHEAHHLVLHPERAGSSPRVWMAHPFSDVPTHYAVDAGDRLYSVNCAWDALALPPLLGLDAEIRAKSPRTGDPLHLEVKAGELRPTTTFMHFVVPAAKFWDDIGFT